MREHALDRGLEHPDQNTRTRILTPFRSSFESCRGAAKSRCKIVCRLVRRINSRNLQYDRYVHRLVVKRRSVIIPA
jgi:hypothetical protein